MPVASLSFAVLGSFVHKTTEFCLRLVRGLKSGQLHPG